MADFGLADIRLAFGKGTFSAQHFCTASGAQHSIPQTVFSQTDFAFNFGSLLTIWWRPRIALDRYEHSFWKRLQRCVGRICQLAIPTVKSTALSSAQRRSSITSEYYPIRFRYSFTLQANPTVPRGLCSLTICYRTIVVKLRRKAEHLIYLGFEFHAQRASSSVPPFSMVTSGGNTNLPS